MTDTLTHAITERQPRAWVAAAGYCPVLMSDTRPPLEREGQLIGIHASTRTWTVEEWGAHLDRLVALQLSPPTVYPRGALIGVARLVGVVRELSLRELSTPSRSRYGVALGRAAGALVMPVSEAVSESIRPWHSGSKWGLLLTDAVLLPEPIPMRGAGGVWFIPSSNPMASSELASRALEQWRKSRGTT